MNTDTARKIWKECRRVKSTTDGRKHAELHAFADWIMAELDVSILNADRAERAAPATTVIGATANGVPIIDIPGCAAHAEGCERGCRSECAAERAAPAGLLEAVDSVLETAPCDCSHKRRYEDGEHMSGCYLFDLNIERCKIPTTGAGGSHG